MLKLFTKINPVSFFVLAAILSALAYSMVRPPMQSPDEFNHFCRAYQVSEGKFLPEKKDQRLGGEIPVCLDEFMSIYRPSTFVPGYRTTFKDVMQGFDIEFSGKEKVFKDFPNTSYYSPVCYLPQACALFFLKKLNCSVGTLYYGTKLFVFIVWLLCMVFVLKTLPMYKWLFTALILLPMNVYITTSLSADTVTNILSFILIALVLKYTFKEDKLSKKDFCFLLMVCVFLALTKVVYVSLLLLLLIIPTRNFKTAGYKFSGIAVIILISFIAGFLWSGTIMTYFIPFSEYNPDYRGIATLQQGADYQKQKEHLLHNGFHIFKVVYNTMVGTAKFYLRSYIGHFGTYMDSPVPIWFFVTSFVILILIALFEATQFVFSWFQKLIFFLTAVGAYSMVVLSQHLIWNDVGSEIADSIQGRYLIPVIPMLFLLFNNSWTKVKINGALLVIPFVLWEHAYVSKMLYKRYFRESCISKIDFSCDMETINGRHFFKTSDPYILLEGGDKRTTTEHRSGKYSLAVPPDSCYTATYKFKDLRFGDLVEIYVWQKGTDGEIIIRGHGSKCQPYYFANYDIQLKEKSGWKKMQMIFNMFLKCDSSDVTFNLHNPTKDTVYFDDLKFCVKKLK